MQLYQQASTRSRLTDTVIGGMAGRDAAGVPAGKRRIRRWIGSTFSRMAKHRASVRYMRQKLDVLADLYTHAP